jgi:hypothetical protein
VTPIGNLYSRQLGQTQVRAAQKVRACHLQAIITQFEAGQENTLFLALARLIGALPVFRFMEFHNSVDPMVCTKMVQVS